MARPMANPDATYALYYKGRYQMAGSATDIAAFVHAHTPHSLNYALKFEGWSVRPVGARRNPGRAGYGHFPHTLLDVVQETPGSSDYASWGNVLDNQIGVLVERAYASVYLWQSARLLVRALHQVPERKGRILSHAQAWRGIRASDVGEVLNQARREVGVGQRNPELPGAPAVESISVAAGSQPQQALVKSGYTVLKTEGQQAVMVPPKGNPSSRRPRVGAVVRLADGEVARLVKREKDGNWLVRLLGSYREKIVSRGLCGAKMVTTANPRRPTKAFMAGCMKGVGPGYDPGAVCASTWYKMSAAAKRKWMARENPGLDTWAWLVSTRVRWADGRLEPWQERGTVVTASNDKRIAMKKARSKFWTFTVGGSVQYKVEPAIPMGRNPGCAVCHKPIDPRVGGFSTAIGPFGKLRASQRKVSWCRKCEAKYAKRGKEVCDMLHTKMGVKGNPSPLPDPFTVNRETYFDVADGLYWFAMQHHGGQASTLYAVGSSLGFKPSPLAKGPEEGLPREVYRALHKMWKKAPNTVDRMAEIMGRQIKQVMKYKENPAPGENLLEQRTAFRRAKEMALKKGWDRVFVVFNHSTGNFEILEHPPVMGRCWEVDLKKGLATPHNNPQGDKVGEILTEARREARNAKGNPSPRPPRGGRVNFKVVAAYRDLKVKPMAWTYKKRSDAISMAKHLVKTFTWPEGAKVVVLATSGKISLGFHKSGGKWKECKG